MDAFDRKFYKREQKLRRNYGLDESLYMRLKELSQIYEATVGDLLNASLERFITSGKIALSEKINCANIAMHPFSIRESNVAGLEKLKEKYGLSVQQMVNPPIKNALDDCSQPQEQTIKIDPSLSKIKARGFLPAFRPVAASIRDAQGLHLVGPQRIRLSINDQAVGRIEEAGLGARLFNCGKQFLYCPESISDYVCL